MTTKPSTLLEVNERIKDVIVRNVMSSEGPWVLINLKADPTTVITSGPLRRDRWIDCIAAMEDRAVEAQEAVPQGVK